MKEINIKHAIEEDDYLGIKQAIKHGVDLEQIIENELNENEESLLFYALHRKCSHESVMLLIDSGIDIDKVDEYGVSFLDEAITGRYVEVVTYLLETKGVDVNLTQRKSGFTPLMQAACYGYMEIVKILLKHGADINAKDSGNLNVMDYARKLQRKSMQEFLEFEINK